MLRVMEKRVLEQDRAAASSPFPPSSAEKKLRLFGFDVDPRSNYVVAEHGKGDEIAISAHTVKERSLNSNMRYECQFCYKKFTNSQALGGHQNAHKKERLKKRKLQLEARKASINDFYLQPFQFSSWYYKPVFTHNKECQINFNPIHQKTHFNVCHDLYSFGLQIYVPFQEDSDTFTLAGTNKYEDKNNPLIIRSAELPDSKQSCEVLDFQLGLVAKQ